MRKSCTGYNLSENELWRHSVAAALASEHLQKFTSVPIPPSAFSAALMHDIGKLVLGRHLGHETLRTSILELMEKKNYTYLDAEREILKTDHAEVGAAIAREWNLPEVLENAIGGHHTPDLRPNPTLDVVHVANAVAKLAGQGLGIEEMNMQVSPNAAERLGIHAEQIQALCALVKVELENTENLWANG
jgi:putative nucleotidyltransferase with HDIG domain